MNGSFVVVSAENIKSEHDASTAKSDNGLNVTFEIKLLFRQIIRCVVIAHTIGYEYEEKKHQHDIERHENAHDEAWIYIIDEQVRSPVDCLCLIWMDGNKYGVLC